MSTSQLRRVLIFLISISYCIVLSGSQLIAVTDTTDQLDKNPYASLQDQCKKAGFDIAGQGESYTRSPYEHISAEEVEGAICAAYLRNQQYLSSPKDGANGQIHWWGDTYQVQDFHSAVDGLSAIIIFNPTVRTAFVVRDGIWEEYKNTGGVRGDLGGPLSDEINYDIQNNKHQKAINYFMSGYLRWERFNNTVRRISWEGSFQPHYRDVPGAPTDDLQSLFVYHTFYKFIMRLFDGNISKGCAEQNQKKFFCPERYVSRGEMAVLVARALFNGEVNVPRITNLGVDEKFADVDAELINTDIFVRSIYALRRMKIIEGSVDQETGERNFYPNRFVTRAEAVSMMMRTYYPDQNYPVNDMKNNFPDLDDKDPHTDAIILAHNFDFISGYSDGTFRPHEYITRGAMAKVVCNAFLHTCDSNVALQSRIGWTYIAPGIRQRIITSDNQLNNKTASQIGAIAEIDLSVPGVRFESVMLPTGEAGHYQLDQMENLLKYGPFHNFSEVPYVAINGVAHHGDGELWQGRLYKSCDGRIAQELATVAIDSESIQTPHGTIPSYFVSNFNLEDSGRFKAFIRTVSDNLPANENIYLRRGVPVDIARSIIIAKDRQGYGNIIGNGPTVLYPVDNLPDSDWPVTKALVSSDIRITSPEPSDIEGKRKSMIGVKYGLDGYATHIYLAVAPNEITYEKFMHQIRAAGAHHVVTLDGGGSAQYKSFGRGREHHYFETDPLCNTDPLWGSNQPRKIINTIVAYYDANNQSALLEKDTVVSADGGTYDLGQGLSGKFAEQSFAPNSSSMTNRLQESSSTKVLEEVTIMYRKVATPQIDTELYQPTGHAFNLRAQTADSAEVIASKSFTLTMRYNSSILPTDIDVNRLNLYHLSDSDWVEAEDSILSINDEIVTIQTTKFGTWSLMSPVKPLEYVDATFQVSVPEYTAGTVFITGNMGNSSSISPTAYPMKQQKNGIWNTTISIPRDVSLLYAYTRGSWETLEFSSVSNTYEPRTLHVSPTNMEPITINDINLEGNESLAVQTWLDPLVVEHTPKVNASGADDMPNITVQWSKPMTPTVSFTVVDADSNSVAGTFDYDDATYTVTFIPTVPLAVDASYTVTVANQMAADGAIQQVPVTWTFTAAPTNLGEEDEPIAPTVESIYLPYISAQ